VAWKEGAVRLLDQTRLPTEVAYVDCRDVEAVIQAIQSLQVRGAPAIAIAGAFGVALAAQRASLLSSDDFHQSVLLACDRLSAARPTAVHLSWAVTRMRQVAQNCRHLTPEVIKKELLTEAHAILKEDIAINRAIGQFGASLVTEGDGVLTYCNTGALATGGHGTALGVIRSAWTDGIRVHVFACETRPVLQGARLTAWELVQEQIPVTLITDNMAGFLMQRGRIQCCIVGADRIAKNGDTANKIGTYGLAVLAHAHGIPFYIAAPTATLDVTLPSGDHIPIEERPPHEITHIGPIRIAPQEAATWNPAFDVTPARYITAVITEQGVFKPASLSSILRSRS
jgi:methylthioribose-1-phosphate isomerase